MPKLVKMPTAIYDQLDAQRGLKAGDILIMAQNPRSLTFNGRATNALQFVLDEDEGQNNTENAALVIEENGSLKVAHLLGVGFVIEDINTKRTKHVYRIKDEADRALIATELNKLITTNYEL